VTGARPRQVPHPQDAGGKEVGTVREAPDELRGSRRALHIGVVLIIVLPAAIWAVRSSPVSGDRLPVEEPGQPAPDFDLHLFDGSTFSLTRHLAGDGRPVVMNSWASWCVPCREEMPAIDAVARRRSEVQVLGVAVEDTETAARGFAEETDVSYPLAVDSDGAIAAAYPTLGLPTTWFITGDGVIAAKVVGELDQRRLEDLIDRYLSGSAD